jgi:hypothetical protein
MNGDFEGTHCKSGDQLIAGERQIVLEIEASGLPGPHPSPAPGSPKFLPALLGREGGRALFHHCFKPQINSYHKLGRSIGCIA